MASQFTLFLYSFNCSWHTATLTGLMASLIFQYVTALSSSTTHALYLSAFLPNLYVLPLSLSTLLLLSFSLPHFPSLLFYQTERVISLSSICRHTIPCVSHLCVRQGERVAFTGGQDSKSSSTSFSLAIFTQITGDINNKLFDFTITSSV